ncbi:MAG: sulfatase [Gracilimonas sp.]
MFRIDITFAAVLLTMFLCTPAPILFQVQAQDWAPADNPLMTRWSEETDRNNSPVNIVVFVADDLGYNDIGPYGNSQVRTPNLDKLSERALKFNEAFAGSPTCSPSRASIYTGLYPFRNGAHANHTGIKEGVKTLPKYLQELGYRTALAGKYHVGPIEAYPFELIKTTNVPEPGYEDRGLLWTDLNMEPVNEWLGKVSDNEPFLLIVNDHSPHVVWPENPEYDYREVDIPSFHIDTDETRQSRSRYYTDITKMDANVGKLMKSLEEHGLSENTIFIFTADQGPQWAFGKWSLYDYGIKVPLLMKWPDVIKEQLETNAMISLVDLVPTFIEIAGGNPDNQQNFDGESFLAVIKEEKDDHHERVFASHSGDGTMNRTPLRMLRTSDYKYILNLAPQTRYDTHMNKADDHDGGREYWPSWQTMSFVSRHAASVLWRYHYHPAEELYDIKSDPNEVVNLAKNPDYKEVIEELRIQMTDWRQQQGDSETGAYERERQNIHVPYIFE